MDVFRPLTQAEGQSILDKAYSNQAHWVALSNDGTARRL